MGETCTFHESGTSVVKFCENGCCAEQCCSSTSVDTKALAIAIAVILAVLFLIALIILFIYCYLKRSKRGKNKTDWRHKDMALTEMQPSKNGNRKLANGIIGPFRKTSKLIQTGDPNPAAGDHILWGSPHRFSSIAKSKSSPAKPTQNHEKTPIDSFTQTQEDDVSHYRQSHLPNSVYTDDHHNQISALPPSLFLSEKSELQNKEVQTVAPKPNPTKAPNRDNKTQYLPAWTPKASWKPSAQFQSLSKDTQKPLSASDHSPFEPYYPVHRCPPDSSPRDSDRSSSRSMGYTQ